MTGFASPKAMQNLAIAMQYLAMTSNLRCMFFYSQNFEIDLCIEIARKERIVFEIRLVRTKTVHFYSVTLAY